MKCKKSVQNSLSNSLFFFSLSLFLSCRVSSARLASSSITSLLPFSYGLNQAYPFLCRHPLLLLLLLLLHLLFILLVPPDIPHGLIRTRERMRCVRPNNPFKRDGKRAPLTQQSVAGFLEFLAARNAPWSPVGSRLLLNYWHFKLLMAKSQINLVVLSMNDDASTSHPRHCRTLQNSCFLNFGLIHSNRLQISTNLICAQLMKLK